MACEKRHKGRSCGISDLRSWTIGDKPSDMAAGRAAGIGTLVLLDPTVPAARRDGDLWMVPDLAAVTELLHSTAPG